MDNGLSTNIEELYDKFLKLNSSEMTKTLKKALVEGARELKNTTISNLDSSILVKGTSMDALHSGVQIGKVKGEYGEDLEVKVNIMGNKLVHGGRDRRLMWLENGTDDRYTKTWKGKELNKPRYTGRMTGKFFFKSANDAVIPRLDQIYASTIDKTIDKINKTKIS